MGKRALSSVIIMIVVPISLTTFQSAEVDAEDCYSLHSCIAYNQFCNPCEGSGLFTCGFVTETHQPAYFVWTPPVGSNGYSSVNYSPEVEACYRFKVCYPISEECLGTTKRICYYDTEAEWPEWITTPTWWILTDEC